MSDKLTVNSCHHQEKCSFFSFVALFFLLCFCRCVCVFFKKALQFLFSPKRTISGDGLLFIHRLLPLSGLISWCGDDNIHISLPCTFTTLILYFLYKHLSWVWVLFVCVCVCVSLQTRCLQSSSSVHVVLVVPRHILAIFTPRFTFRKWNHGWNIHGQLWDFTPRGCK